MNKLFLLPLFLMFASTLTAQNQLKVLVKDSLSDAVLPGATVYIKNTTIGAAAIEDGIALITGIPDGTHHFVITFIGYKSEERVLTFPPSMQNLTVLLSAGEELEEIIIESTRANKSIENLPTRTEVLTEEIEEAATMEPSRIAHLITHSTGIQVQQLSATSGYANVRIQGLDGRYALFLKDGFPLYGGFSGCLSIMHIPPLDLRQVEYIKGPASTLYGAGAISGLINLISKEPSEDGELSVMRNKSHLGSTDFNSFYSKKGDKSGITMYAGYNKHTPFDADDDGFSDIPAQEKFNFNPRIFFRFDNKTKAYAGLTITSEKRAGGDMLLLDERAPDSTNFYREKNNSAQLTTQIFMQRNFTHNTLITLKNSFNIFERTIGIISKHFDEYLFSVIS